MKNLLLTSLALTGILFTSCNKKENSKTASGKIEFTVSTQSNKALKSALAVNASSILISIEDTSGKSIYDSEIIALINFNGTYISQPISLNIGNYNLTKFMVIDSAGKVIYATPVKGSSNAYLVQNPLPISFNISENNTTKLTPEVLSTDESTPAEFGYFDASFQVINTFDFLVSVMVYDATSQNFQLTDASITISDSAKDLYTLPLSAITNKITVNDGYGAYKITISKSGYTSYVKTFTRDSLKNCFNSPLIVTLSSSSVDINSGLVAYYPFNGNANDASGNGNNGTVNGATLCADRSGNVNSAYSFNGISNNITIPAAKMINNQFSYAMWANLNSSLNTGATSMLFSIGSSGGDQHVQYCNYYFDHNGWTFGGYNVNELPFSVAQETSPNINQWYFLAVTRSENILNFYVDGFLVKSDTLSTSENPYYGSGTIQAIIGARFDLSLPFNGKIDEVRIYNRVLNNEAILTLYNQESN